MTNFCNIYIDNRSLGLYVAASVVTTFIINSILGRDSKGPKTVGEILCQDRLQDVFEMPKLEELVLPPSKAYILIQCYYDDNFYQFKIHPRKNHNYSVCMFTDCIYS